ncbi:MAG: hypothetical protein MJ060_01645 [Clostridia bacterium]|nr:hypothetical protein [Clostridia bacterium]
MGNFWNMTINFMNQCWDKAIEYLTKLNLWIPLSAVLLAGAVLVAIVLILAICGCALRKRLVPNWLIWTYFTFATIIVFAHTGNDLETLVANLEIPVLVVLLCYVLRVLFSRRSRYTYVEKNVYARELAKGRVYVVKADGEIVDEKKQTAREIKKAKKAAKNVKAEQAVEEVVEQENTNQNVAVNVETEAVSNEKELAEKASAAEAEAARLAVEEEAARAAREQEQAARETIRVEQVKTEPVKRVDKDDFLNVRTTRAEAPQSTVNFTSINLPNVQPIPDKSYEPMREPTIVTTPVSQRIPDLKIPTSSVNRSTITTSRPTTMTSNVASTTTTVTPNRTVMTEVKTTPSSTTTSSMYNPRIVKTTTTTTTTTNNTAPHSTDDIMAAIERLRASMKKN